MNKENGWDASASWNGYMYQGKVALLITLKTINDIDDTNGYWLELEGIEDFSIGLNNNYRSVHQVKNRKDNKLEDYKEALSNIVRMIREHPDIINGYLHTKNEIKSENLEQEIMDKLESYYPEKIQKLQDIVQDNDKNDIVYNEIVEKWNEKIKRMNRNTTDINKLIIDKIEKNNSIKNKEDITKEMFKVASRQVLQDEKKNYDFSEKKEAIKKILLYTYPNDNGFADSTDIVDMTLDEIKIYWGEYKSYREEKVNIYYMKLMELINDNITKRAEIRSKNIRILFTEFKDILNLDTYSICTDTKEEELLRLKYLYLKEKDDFCEKDICEVKSEKNCLNCKLEEISNYIVSSPLTEMEGIFRIMSLHKKGKFTEKGFELFGITDLENAFFAGITEIDKEFFMNQCKVLCQINDKFMMSTTISAEKQGRKKLTIEGLIENDIQDVCKKIIKNDEYDTELMEVDKLLTRDFDTEDVFEEACKINVITKDDDNVEDELKYMNITKTKKVGLISIENAKNKYGERK
ncbi:hypothetical protein CLRAG_23800 [Clostridium ragsdalei P11]|uniref:ABC-three component systems C-terminal domain-containing protein n=1 Tax=Clostridium ragsdalei P11 TaxID=1353534 RepID=A0A1A6ARH9_9CLOT|nr:ABC-three component system protein [Clostridium ragsdalei]OBR92674.1 hypothetical protein CLRAG_23800 [Clostridium ragsdalei P11]